MVKVYGRYVNVMKYNTYLKSWEEQNSLMRLLEGREDESEIFYNGFDKRFFNWSYIFPYRGIGALLHKAL